MNSDTNNLNGDAWIFKGPNGINSLEYVSPFKLCVVILLQELCHIRNKNRGRFQVSRVLFYSDKQPSFRRDFCMLILHLIQSPDLDYRELLNLLLNGKYKASPDLVKKFRKKMVDLWDREAGCIQDILNNVDFLPGNSNVYELMNNKTSKIGLFLRRVKLNFEKLSFSQTVSVYKMFQAYIQMGQLSAGVRDENQDKSKEDLEESKENSQPSLARVVRRLSMAMDVSETAEASQQETSRVSNEKSLEEQLNEIDLDAYVPDIGVWSKRQAEYFMVQQAKLLIDEPHRALPPPELQEKLREVLLTNPDQAEAHYLSYLNCLRVREYSGSMDSIFHYFDRKPPNSFEEDAIRTRGLRYAALNLAILLTHFERKQEAITALKEAITLSHEANDGVCLQHAQAWMCKLQLEDMDIMIQRSIAKSSELKINFLLSFGFQAFAEYVAKAGHRPSEAFTLLNQSEVLNVQHSQMDLIACNLASKVALWAMYGKADMAMAVSQIILYLDSDDCSRGLRSYSGGDSLTLAVANLCNYFTLQGEYQTAWALVSYGKNQCPDSKWWIWAENILYFNEAIHKDYWQHAQLAVNQLVSVDEEESLLRQSELLLVKGNNPEAQRFADEVLEKFEHLTPVNRIRALVLSAKAYSNGAIMKLCDALHLAEDFNLGYWKGVVGLEIANLQVDKDLVAQAAVLMDECLSSLLFPLDISDAIVLQAQCRAKMARESGQEAEVYPKCIQILNKATELAERIGNFTRAKRIVYLQAFMCNSIGMIAERNKYSHKFRLLEENFP